MRRVIVSGATGPHQRLLSISAPTLLRFGVEQQADVRLEHLECEGLPPSWGKVPALQRALSDYDEALWVDADAIVIKFDAWPELAPGTFQGLAPDIVPFIGPNSGVWLLRSSVRSMAFLDEVWKRRRSGHSTWEQGAVKELLGFPPSGQGPESATTWRSETTTIGREWNTMHGGTGRIHHYAAAPFDVRERAMRTDLAIVEGRLTLNRARRKAAIAISRTPLGGTVRRLRGR